MPYYRWASKKNERLKTERGVGFERVVLHIDQGDVLGVYEHPSRNRHPGQRILGDRDEEGETG